MQTNCFDFKVLRDFHFDFEDLKTALKSMSRVCEGVEGFGSVSDCLPIVGVGDGGRDALEDMR
jgi:hypothetical protein